MTIEKELKYINKRRKIIETIFPSQSTKSEVIRKLHYRNEAILENDLSMVNKIMKGRKRKKKERMGQYSQINKL